jgi:(2Fe-2S) ferredoxin
MSHQPVNRKRVVLCRGQYCNMSGRADKLYRLLQSMIDDLNGGEYPPRIKLENANCLDMCGAGPNCIIYPENIVCNHLDEESLKRIVDEHLTDE